MTFRYLWIFFITLVGLPAYSENIEAPSSPREKINLGDTPWKFIKADPFPAAKEVTFDDSAWSEVGVPHCFNESDSFVNASAGVDGMYHGTVWYRKHFAVPAEAKGRRVYIEFEGVNIACAVYINGHFKPTNSQVPQPGEVTHVFGFTPFVIDVTDDVNPGSADNILAVRVSNGRENWYTFAGFGEATQFGMSYGGIFRPVYLHITDPVHVPLNVYANVNNWGTSVATLAADENAAKIGIQTNVENDQPESADVTLETQVVDASGQVVMKLHDQAVIAPGTTRLFDQQGSIDHPHLWFPNDGHATSQYLYKVYSIVRTGGRTTDVFESPLGVRVITWDENYPYFNGRKFELYGFGSRYDYPGLGSALPEARHWADIQLLAACGGNLLRPGHAPSSEATVAACDAYGVALAQPSGDNEFIFRDASASTRQYKLEAHRDLLVRDRNHPSIAFWEISNGGVNPDFLPDLLATTKQWDNLMPREVSPRATKDYPWPAGTQDDTNRDAVKVLGACFDGIGTKQGFPSHPVWTAESWIFNSPRDDWDRSVKKAEIYVQKVEDSRKARLFGFAHWYLAESTGENSSDNHSRTLGCAAMDATRIPELIYNVYKNAQLIPFQIRPGVTLGGHWNRSGQVDVDAWSNCPHVRLELNGKSLGEKEPDPPAGPYPYRTTWSVAWEAGTLRVVGLDETGREVCSDQVVTAADPDHLELSVEPPTMRPDGGTFPIQANATDAAYVLARVVDKDGNLCPLANMLITFAVSGPGRYCGSWNHVVTDGKPLSYHAPGDPELNAEAGQIKVAVRSTFTPGDVTVTASSPGLADGKATFEVVPVGPQIVDRGD